MRSALQDQDVLFAMNPMLQEAIGGLDGRKAALTAAVKAPPLHVPNRVAALHRGDRLRTIEALRKSRK